MRLTLILVVLLLASAACRKAEEKPAEAPAPVQVTAVTQDTIRRIVSGDGILYARDQESVTPKISAPVSKFTVNRGDHVKAGQLVATLENRDLIASAAEARGALAQAESNLRTIQGASVPEAVVKAQTDVEAARPALEASKKVLESRQQLFKEGALARRLVDEAQVAYVKANSDLQTAVEHLRALQSVSKEEQVRTAAAQVEAARSHLQSLEAQVSYSQIHTRINGVVSDRPLYPGEMASAGVPLLTVMDISSVVARVNIPQAQATLVKVGHAAVLTQTDSGEEVHGSVIVVSPATDAASTTIQVWIQAANPGEKLKPGASVHAAIITELFKAATVVPATAILPGEEGGTIVLTVSSDSTAHKKPVQSGVREGNKVQILSGVNPGEEVVVVGGMGVDDKAKVKIIDTSVKEEEEEPEAEEKPSPGKEPKKGGEAAPKSK